MSGVPAGSTFWAELPLVGIAAPNEGETKPDLPDFGRVRVLVIDDDPMQRAFAMMMLQEFGVRPDQAGGPAEAQNAFRKQPFDLVLMDYNLGEKTGIDLMSDLRARVGFDRDRAISMSISAS